MKYRVVSREYRIMDQQVGGIQAFRDGGLSGSLALRMLGLEAQLSMP